ncbi:Protein T2 [Marasmius crinis-equi]|uniref:Protein T2 n=1 Tax=Marasmius crinis-equi TaxID=585013 RepID=A0ABR3FML0_9AGAR
MPLSRANTTTGSGRSRSRSPAHPPVPGPQSPRQFLPTSHYATAAGLKMPEKIQHVCDDAQQQAEKISRLSYMPYISPRSTPSNDSIDFQSNSPYTGNSGNTAESRRKRESQISNLPMVESQLLPSLRDTIDRMTRPPSRSYSKTGPSTPTLKISTDADSYWPIATESSPRPPSRPYTPQSHPTKYAPEDSLAVSSQPSTPKLASSTPKSALKSALRSPNSKIKPDNSENTTPQSGNGGTLKSVRSLLRRKSSAATGVGSATKQELKENKPPESFSVQRTTGRSRSKTDPGTRPPSQCSKDAIPLPATPQPPVHPSKAFNSNIPRFRSNYIGGATTNLTDDSDLENRFEQEARQRRRLTVINAKIPPCSSSSESEAESLVMSPATDLDVQTLADAGRERIVGLGLDFNQDISVTRRDGSRNSNHLTNAKRYSLESCASVASIYTEDETEDIPLQNQTYGTRQSIDSLDEKHMRRRETLLGLVRGLDLHRVSTHLGTTGGDDSDYHGEPGLAFSGSGEVSAQGALVDDVPQAETTDSESEYEQEERLEERTPVVEVPSSSLRSKSQDSGTAPHVSAYGRRPGRAPLPSRSPKLGNDTDRTVRSPRLVDDSTSKVPTPSISKKKYARYDSGSKSQPSTPSLSNTLCPQPHLPGRDSFNYESVIIAKRSREAAARGREALGIPPSESDETIPHADSIVSSIDGDLNNDKDDGQLSTGAEALFETLCRGGGGGGGGRRAKEDTALAERGGQGDFGIKVKSVEVDGHRKSRHRTSSRPESPSGGDRRYVQQAKISGERQSRGTWKSTLSSSTYTSLLHRHGELEMNRQETIWELYRSEVDFVDKLGSIVKLFILPLRVQNSRTWISGVPLEIAKILDWVEDIATLHKQIRDTLTGIQAAKRPTVDFVAGAICGFVPKLEIYQPYLVKIDGVLAMLQRLLDDESSDFGEFVKIQERETGDEVRLIRLLKEPVQRLELYLKLFKQLLGTTPKTHGDYLSTLTLVHSTNLMIKVLTEVKTREDEYGYIQDISQRIVGLPHNLGLPRRERRLLCQGEVNLVEAPASSVSPSIPSSPSVYTSRLVDAIQEWKNGRERSGSNASSSTFASAHSAETSSTFVDVPKSPLFGMSARASPLHFQDTRSLKPPSSSSTQVFLFSDLIVLAQPRARRSSERRDHASDRWNLLEEIGIARVLDVVEHDGSDVIAVDIIPIQETSVASALHLKTLYFAFPENTDVPSREAWTRGLRRSSKSTLAAMSNPSSNERQRGSVTALNEALDDHSSRILDTIAASGLPPPKSPSMQLDGVEGDSVKLEREERGWWSVRFQQVLKVIRDEEKYSN